MTPGAQGLHTLGAAPRKDGTGVQPFLKGMQGTKSKPDSEKCTPVELASEVYVCLSTYR